MKRSRIRRKPRPSTPEERAWYKRIHDEIPCCVLCGSNGPIQVAHENYNKAMGKKRPYWRSAALCVRCHTSIDSGKDLTRDERRQLMEVAIQKTHELLGVDNHDLDGV